MRDVTRVCRVVDRGVVYDTAWPEEKQVKEGAMGLGAGNDWALLFTE
jgi:hypothetical protein